MIQYDGWVCVDLMGGDIMIMWGGGDMMGGDIMMTGWVGGGGWVVM